jgi:peptidoglycan/xylan/chitin deacetylase (PgdA/CDA1 family)
MSKIIRIFFDFIARLSPKLAYPYIIILNYHSILNNDLENEWSVSLDTFDNQMKYLKDNNIEIIALKDIENIYKKTSISKKIYACITFDDGLENNFNNAIPILNKYKIKNATFFIVGNSLEKKFNTAWWIKSKKKMKLMNANQISIVSNIGHEIGSHLFYHKNLNKIDGDEIEKEVVLSKNIIANKCNLVCKSIAIPFSISGNSKKEIIVKNICLKNGYSFLFLGRFGYLKYKNLNKNDLPRIPIYRSDTMKTFILKVNGKFDIVSKIYFFRKKIKYFFGV